MLYGGRGKEIRKTTRKQKGLWRPARTPTRRVPQMKCNPWSVLEHRPMALPLHLMQASAQDTRVTHLSISWNDNFSGCHLLDFDDTSSDVEALLATSTLPAETGPRLRCLHEKRCLGAVPWPKHRELRPFATSSSGYGGYSGNGGFGSEAGYSSHGGYGYEAVGGQAGQAPQVGDSNYLQQLRQWLQQYDPRLNWKQHELRKLKSSNSAL